MPLTLYFSICLDSGASSVPRYFPPLTVSFSAVCECRRRADSFHNFRDTTLDEDMVNLLETETRGFGKDDVDDGNKYEVLQSHTVSCYFLFRNIQSCHHHENEIRLPGNVGNHSRRCHNNDKDL